jgi:glutaredoxin 3
MAEIIVYSKGYCPYCKAAKALLAKKGASFTEIDVTSDLALHAQMVDRAGGRRTVPQIFINGAHIGGSDDLHALDAAGKLDPLLTA